MRKNTVLVIAVLLFLAVDLLLSYLFIFSDIFTSCKIILENNSNYISFQITNKKQFASFVKRYLPCKDNLFVLGDPTTGIGPQQVRTFRLVITDNPGKLAAYPNVEEAKKGDTGQKNFTYDYQIDEANNTGKLFIQFDPGYIKSQQFSTLLPLVLAGRLDIFYKYNNPQAWLERTARPENFPERLENIGLSYELL